MNMPFSSCPLVWIEIWVWKSMNFHVVFIFVVRISDKFSIQTVYCVKKSADIQNQRKYKRIALTNLNLSTVRCKYLLNRKTLTSTIAMNKTNFLASLVFQSPKCNQMKKKTIIDDRQSSGNVILLFVICWIRK